MKFKFSYILLLILIASNAFAQLKLFPLTEDLKRNEIPKPIVKSKNLRVAATGTDSVNLSAYIKLISGSNPRCTSSPNTTLTYEAFAINGGSTPTYEWFVDGNSAGTGKQYTSSSLTNNQIIYCKVISSLTCVRQNTYFTRPDTIKVTDKVNSGITISVSGDILACFAKSPLIFSANVVNGGDNPDIKWFRNRTFTGITGSTYQSDSVANGERIYAQLTSNLECSNQNGVVIRSDSITRRTRNTITPEVTISFTGITNDDCSSKKYNFTANVLNGGNNPTISWYLNKNFVTTSGTNFSISMPTNGDEISVSLTSSLACALPATVNSLESYQRTDSLLLPFFEDFSRSFSQPNSNLWIKNGGTYVNNSFPINPPSFNAATFDGLMYNGRPYDTIIPSLRGQSDNLTSLPINLAKVIDTSSVYLSFAWQAQGRGERPEAIQGDNLTVYFKNADDLWIPVWEQGGDSVENFKQAIIKINNSSTNRFLHGGFQFRFQTTGRLSGAFDIWNVDYIYLNEKRNPKDTVFLDQSFGNQLSSLLDKFTSVPYWNFQQDPSGYLRKNIFTTANNLDTIFNINEIRAYVESNKTGFVTNLKNTENPRIEARAKGNLMVGTINGNDFSNLVNEPVELRTSFAITSGNTFNPDNKGIDYRINDTITGTTILDNFYAYDDGSAEYGIGINQRNAMVAYKFSDTLALNDTLRQLAIYFTRLGKTPQSLTFPIFITSNLPKYADLFKIPYSNDIYYVNNTTQVKYQNTVNNFSIYNINPPVILQKGTFYIGFIQTSDDPITIGWDVNTNSADNIYYYLNATQGWLKYEDTQGSMMIRPVFGEYRYLASNKEKISLSEISIYPNPANDIMYIQGEYDDLSLFDMNGICYYNKIKSDHLDISILPAGIYTVKIVKGNVPVIKKLIKY